MISKFKVQRIVNKFYRFFQEILRFDKKITSLPLK